jgi:hypothetical protein
MGNPLARHALGLPQLGSPEDTRYAIAQGVKNDPIFKYKTAAEQAAQVETLFAVATGKMIDPVARTAMAQGIASYQFAPLEGRPLAMPGGAETMKEVLAINPQYQASKYPEISKAMTAFATGPQGNAVRFNNVGVQHLDVLDQAAQNLGNTDVNVANQLKNAFQQQFGSPAPTTFNALKQIVGTEIEKAIAGGIGAAADRDRIMKSLSDANSPEQLINVTNGFRALMVGQLAGLKQQYEEATGFKSGPFAFENKLAPETIAKLQGGGAAHIAPTTNTTSPAGALANAPMGGLYGATTGTTGTAPANPALLKLWGQ